MKGQVSVEYIMLIGLILVILIPLMFYSINKVNSDIKEQKIYDSLRSITETANKVYALGAGSKLYEWINIPSGIINYTIEGNEISLKTVKGDFLVLSQVDMSGSLPINEGSYKIAIEAMDNFVRIRGEINESEIICGDDIAEGLEVCDGTDLNGMTCILLGFAGGDLDCLSDCSSYDNTDCISGSICGNGIIEAGEDCDTGNLNGETCISQGYAGGILGCSDCNFNYSSCIPGGGSGECGNNLSEFGEVCDGTDLNSETCQSQGFDGGALKCLSDCSNYDTSSCVNVNTCNEYCQMISFGSGNCLWSLLCGIFGGSYQPGGDVYCGGSDCCCYS